MVRLKTELEKSETVAMEAARLRGALFAASTVGNFEEAKRICIAAMRGDLHGYEIKESDSLYNLPEWMKTQSWHWPP